MEKRADSTLKRTIFCSKSATTAIGRVDAFSFLLPDVSSTMFSIWILVQIGTVPSDYWVGTTGLVPGEYWLDTEIYSVTQLRSIIRIPIPSMYYLDDPWFRLQLYAKLGLLKLRTKLQLFQIAYISKNSKKSEMLPFRYSFWRNSIFSRFILLNNLGWYEYDYVVLNQYCFFLCTI